MLVLVVPSGRTAVNYESAVRNAAVVCCKLLFGDKMNGCIIIRKIVRHRLNCVLYCCRIRAFFQNNEALSRVFLSGGQLGIAAGSYASSASGTGIVYCLPFLTPGTLRIASECPWLTPLPQKV